MDHFFALQRHPMNVFFLSLIPSLCAKWHADKHVVKMLLEAMQILYTAHWLSNSGEDWISTAPLNKSGSPGYKKISTPRHPSVLWVMETRANYQWLIDLGTELNKEYRLRYGDKEHAAEAHLFWLQKHFPPSFTTQEEGLTTPKLAMTPECKEYAVEHNLDPVSAYQHYYRTVKLDILTYRNLEIPPFLQNDLKEDENYKRLGLTHPSAVNLLRSSFFAEELSLQTKREYGIDSTEKEELICRAVATQKVPPRNWNQCLSKGPQISRSVRQILGIGNTMTFTVEPLIIGLKRKNSLSEKPPPKRSQSSKSEALKTKK
jgi:hypothetical protein